eukprot:scaffold256043_cov37-Prasinocladus_malaysianus.AAC.1
MLANTPVETQRELIDLVYQVNGSDGLEEGHLDEEAERLLLQQEADSSVYNPGQTDACTGKAGDSSKDEVIMIAAVNNEAGLPGQCLDDAADILCSRTRQR